MIRLGTPDMGEIRVSLRLTNPLDEDRVAEGSLSADAVRTTMVDAVVDTGAVRSVVPQQVLDSIGVRVRSTGTAEYADGRRENVGVTSPIVFELLGRSTTDDAFVLGDEVLIGQTILEKLDLLADCANQRLLPNPENPTKPVLKIR